MPDEVIVVLQLDCFIKHHLARGEIGHVLVLAASRDQARVVFGYARSFLEDSPVLRQEIANITAHEIRFKSGIVIAARMLTASGALEAARCWRSFSTKSACGATRRAPHRTSRFTERRCPR